MFYLIVLKYFLANNINVDFDSFTSNDNSNNNTVSGNLFIFLDFLLIYFLFIDKVSVDNDFVGFTGNANTNEKGICSLLQLNFNLFILEQIDDNNTFTSNTTEVTVNEAKPIIQGNNNYII